MLIRTFIEKFFFTIHQPDHRGTAWMIRLLLWRNLKKQNKTKPLYVIFSVKEWVSQEFNFFLQTKKFQREKQKV